MDVDNNGMNSDENIANLDESNTNIDGNDDQKDENEIAMDTWVAQLQTEQLIKIFVANHTTPLLVQKSVLISMSDWFEKAILREDQFGVNDSGTLNFPADAVDDWKMLLWWKFKGSVMLDHLPMNTDLELALIRAWILGDRYEIKNYQNDVMIELLYKLDGSFLDRDLVTAKYGFEHTVSGSPLRKLILEEILKVWKTRDRIKDPNLDIFDGVPGFITEFTATADRFRGPMPAGFEGLMPDRVGLGDDHKRLEAWKEFMVGDEPYHHWVYHD